MNNFDPAGRPYINAVRLEIAEAAGLLRMSRAALYVRIRRGEIKIHHDGRRAYISRDELERYAAAKAAA